jgi:hypothetical protein
MQDRQDKKKGYLQSSPLRIFSILHAPVYPVPN